MNNEMSVFANTIMQQKYSHIKHDGTLETWEEIASRVAKNVLRAVNAPKTQIERTEKLIAEKKFIPGGRYLYATGRGLHQVQNCALFKAEDSREGWADLMYKITITLMTGAGIGIDYSDIRPEGKSIRKTGGFATGPLALMQMVNEAGRGIVQGGSRRSAIWAGLSWKHQDIHKFISLKNWHPEVRALKEKDFNFPATLDGTNISVLLDDEFFAAFHNEKHKLHSQAQSVYWSTIRQMCKTSEPGFSIDVGENKGETLRNACQPKFATVLTPDGIRQIKNIEKGDIIWSGKDWTTVVNKWSTGTKEVFNYETRAGNFVGTSDHKVISFGERVEAGDAETIDISFGDNKYISVLSLNPQDILDGIVFGDGYIHRASNNLALLCIGENDGDYHTSEVSHLIKGYRPGVAKNSWEITTTVKDCLFNKTYDRTIPDRFYKGSPIKVAGFLRGLFTANGSIAGKRVTLKQTSFSIIRQAQEMLSFLGIRSYYTINKPKEIVWSNGTYTSKQSYDLNISGADREVFYKNVGFIQGYKTQRLKEILSETSGGKAKKESYEVVGFESLGLHEVFDITVQDENHTYWTGGLLVSNCTEISSRDDSDICNLGSINLARITSLEEMREVVELGTAFLLAGTVYSDVPFAKIDQIRTKNRRLGLGLIGVHEWLLLHGQRYEPSEELGKYLEIYKKSGEYAKAYADNWELTIPVKTRAIAPTGTIGILAGSTTGVEPIFCAAYKRRYRKGNIWEYQYVIDPTAKKLVELGIRPEDIEDAYTLAKDVERRVAFQAWVQGYVDHSISSTINIPEWGSEYNNEETTQEFGRMLIKYLPKLRGITVYADGSRGGQPITAVSYRTASKHLGEVFVESADICEISKSGGTCGS